MTVMRVDERGPVWEITLARPAKRNALNRELHAALNTALTRFEADDEAMVAILTGRDPAFCAGMDLSELAEEGISAAGLGGPTSTFDAALRALSKPVIAAVNGAAITGGLEIVLGCDFVIASERAVFGDSHVRVGVFPGGGMTVLLAQAVGVAMARRMSFTGEFIDAETALRVGLVTEVVAHQQLMARARAVAATIAGNDQALVQALRAAYRRSSNLPLDEALRSERSQAESWAVSRERLTAGRADVLSERRHHAPATESTGQDTS